MPRPAYKNTVCTILVWFLIAFNTYPAIHTAMADMAGIDVTTLSICTISGIETIQLDGDTQNDKTVSKQNCPFCFIDHVKTLPPYNNHQIGIVNVYGDRLVVLQYRSTYFKTTLDRPFAHGPPPLS